MLCRGYYIAIYCHGGDLKKDWTGTFVPNKMILIAIIMSKSV